MHSAGHLAEIFFLLAGAQVMGWISQRFGQPAVLGQIVAGILLGPSLLGWVHDGPVLEAVAELGAIFLLFVVGLEIKAREILSVGREAVLVSVIGIICPFAAGYGFGLFAGMTSMATLFIATALVATSVGITAAVLQELNVLSRSYTRIILGAAIIDDIISLIMLSVVSGMARTGTVELMEIAKLTVMSAFFVASALVIVRYIKKIPLDRLPFDGPYIAVVTAGIGVAAAAAAIGLAPIIGAFLAGMMFAEVEHKYDLLSSVEYVEAFLVPVFFAMVGARLDISVLADVTIVIMGLVMSALAIVSKMLSGLGALKTGVGKASVIGVGMTPRGEVVLIVVALGLSTGALTQNEYAMALMMVVITTILAPLLLKPLIAAEERKA